MRTPTFKDLVNFVLEHKDKYKDVFSCMSIEQVIGELRYRLDSGTLLYSTSTDGKINGMIGIEPDKSRKVLMVGSNLALTLETLKSFALEAKKRWPDYPYFEGTKKGCRKIFSIDKLIKKLST